METIKQEKKKFSGSIPAIVFYVLAVVFVLYGAYMIFSVYEYLVSYYGSSGTSMGLQLESTIQYFVANCSSYFVYAVLCYGLGTVIQMIHGLKTQLHTKPEIEEVEAVEVEVTEEK